MLTLKSTIILIFSLVLFSFNSKCQLLINSTENIINPDKLIECTDSIINNNDSDFKAGKIDAKEYYTDDKTFAVAFFSSLLLPPAGLITTIALSTSRPKTENLRLPNENMLKNDSYMEGYIKKASQMKAGRAWGGCLTGLSFFTIGLAMLYPGIFSH